MDLYTAVKRVQWLQHVDSTAKCRPLYGDSQRYNLRVGEFPHINEDRDYHMYREGKRNRNGEGSIYLQLNTSGAENLYRRAASP